MQEQALSRSALENSEAPEYQNGFRIGDVSVQMYGDFRSDVALAPLLNTFRCVSANPDIAIRVEWINTLAPLAADPIFDSGSVWRLSFEERGFCFDFNVPLLGASPYRRLLIDRKFSEATLLMSREAYAAVHCPPDPLEYPLDELLIMHRLTQEKAIELHGTGIVRRNREANLFVGHSGAGKSTTTRLWTDIEDVDVLSDDRIIVRSDDAAQEPEENAGILRLRDRSALPIGHSAQDDNSKKKMRMYGTPWHGEAMYASPNSAPLTRIFVLEHGHGNVIARLTPSQAVAELFARSFVPFHRHEYVDSALSFLEELANAVPVYRYAFEPDQRAVEKIRNFHD